MTFKKAVRNSYPHRILNLLKDHRDWAKRGYAAPSPHFVKQTCIIRNGYPDATWVETGTYLGQTTKVLANHGVKVYSIEPEPKLFAKAKKHFSDVKHVEILNGTSESIFPGLLPTINGNVNFWLDGHYSAGITFKGPQDTPILDELKCISDNLNHFNKACILIDDMRCFDPQQPEYASYPTVDVLVDWAKQHRMAWHIEHDIFVAKN